jgi:hypothetical protein
LVGAVGPPAARHRSRLRAHQSAPPVDQPYVLIEVHNRLLTEPYRVDQGHLLLNGKPGLGYALDKEWLRAHAAPTVS